MTSASLSSSRHDGPPVEKRPRSPDRSGSSYRIVSFDPSERWLKPTARTVSFGMAIVVVASLTMHGILLVTAVMDGSRSLPPPEQEIAVEIVQEKPVAKPESAKRDEAKAETPPAAPPALKPALAEAKPVEPLREEAKRDEVREAPKPPAQPQDKVAALEKEFAALKAERAALEAQQQAAEAKQAAAEAKEPAVAEAKQAAAEASKSRALADAGLGPLPDSFQAVALPATSATGEGEAVGYRDIVFSQLAKANELGKTQGMPGSTGVHFSIDDRGALVDVEIVHASGIEGLDRQALDIVRKAAPFPPPPQGAQRAFDANVSFVAEGAP